MKKVYFIRHAKSSWSNPSLSDFDRPLNNRGKRDAPNMSNFLAEYLNEIPDIMISSPANRALTTCLFFARELGYEESDVIRDQALYHGSPTTFINTILGLESNVNTVCIFGHNPTMTYLANEFSLDLIDNVPTCGIFEVSGEINSWAEFSFPDVERTNFWYPKMFI